MEDTVAGCMHMVAVIRVRMIHLRVGESGQSNVERRSCLEPDSPPLAVIAVLGNRPERLHHVIPQNK